MTDDRLRWDSDGFRLEVERPPRSPLRWLLAAYAATLPLVALSLAHPALAPLFGALLLPLPATLLWCSRPPPRLRLAVDHRRICIDGPGPSRRTIPLREVVDVVVLGSGLAIALRSGRRVELAVEAPLTRLWWLAGRLRELRAELEDFDREVSVLDGDRRRLAELRSKAGS